MMNDKKCKKWELFVKLLLVTFLSIIFVEFASVDFLNKHFCLLLFDFTLMLDIFHDLRVMIQGWFFFFSLSFFLDLNLRISLGSVYDE